MYRAILSEVIKNPGHTIEAFNRAEGKEYVSVEEAYEIISMAEEYDKNAPFAMAIEKLIPEGGRET